MTVIIAKSKKEGENLEKKKERKKGRIQKRKKNEK